MMKKLYLRIFVMIISFAAMMIIGRTTIFAEDSSAIKVAISPSDAEVNPGGSVMLNVSFSGTDTTPSAAWEIEGQTSSGTIITSDGKLTVGEDEKSKNILVFVILKQDESCKAAAIITVTNKTIPTETPTATPTATQTPTAALTATPTLESAAAPTAASTPTSNADAASTATAIPESTQEPSATANPTESSAENSSSGNASVPEEISNTTTDAVKTGDDSPIFTLCISLLILLGVIIAVFVRSGKGKDQ